MTETLQRYPYRTFVDADGVRTIQTHPSVKTSRPGIEVDEGIVELTRK